MNRLPLGLLFWTTALLVSGCAAPRAEEPEVLAPENEESVKPGVNDSFLAEDLDVQEFIDRFEGESREIAVERDALLETIAIEPGMDVADVGAGTGLFLDLLAKAVGDDGRVYAIDISPGFLEHLDRRVEAEGYPQVETVLCSDRSVELPPRSVDRVFICDVYHHFEYPRSTMASIVNAMRPGAELVLVDFERIPGVTREWLLEHVRAGKETFRAEIEESGLQFVEEIDVDGLAENYVLRFRRP